MTKGLIDDNAHRSIVKYRQLPVAADYFGAVCSGIFFPFGALLIVIKCVKRAFKFGEPFRDEVKIGNGAFYGRMAEELFNRVKIFSTVKEVGCEAVAKGMDALASFYAGFFFAM